MKNYLKTSGLCALLFLLGLICVSNTVYGQYKNFLLSPNGGEVFKVNQKDTIRFSGGVYPSGSFMKMYLVDKNIYHPDSILIDSIDITGGASGNYSHDASGKGIYSYDPFKTAFHRSDFVYPVGKNYTIRLVLTYLGVTIGRDESDSVFTVYRKPVKIISPNGGEKIVIGKPYTIQYTSAEYPSPAAVSFGLRDTRFDSETGSGEENVGSDTTNTGSFTFTFPNSLGYLSNGKITRDSQVYKLVMYTDGGGNDGQYDESDSLFSFTKNSCECNCYQAKRVPDIENYPDSISATDSSIVLQDYIYMSTTDALFGRLKYTKQNDTTVLYSAWIQQTVCNYLPPVTISGLSKNTPYEFYFEAKNTYGITSSPKATVFHTK